jgi:hypothetical protein
MREVLPPSDGGSVPSCASGCRDTFPGQAVRDRSRRQTLCTVLRDPCAHLVGEIDWATQTDTLRLQHRERVSSALRDHVTFPFGHRRHDHCYELARRGGGVDPEGR